MKKSIRERRKNAHHQNVRQRVTKKLRKRGAKHIADFEELYRYQLAMTARFRRANVPEYKWRYLEDCDGGVCKNIACSPACWYGDRGNINGLILEAANLLRSTDKPLKFVTIIDPHHTRKIGALNGLSLNGAMQSLRRRIRKEAILATDPAFGFLEVAVQVDAKGVAWWTPHYHLVMATRGSAKQIRRALRPSRKPPSTGPHARKRWRPIVVKRVTSLENALAYSAKRIPERNRETFDETRKRIQQRDRLRSENNLEYDLWLLNQGLSERIFLRGMKRVHGKLVLFHTHR